MRQTAAEILHVNGTFKNMTDSLMMKEAEVSTSVREVEIGKGRGCEGGRGGVQLNLSITQGFNSTVGPWSKSTLLKLTWVAAGL